MNTKYIDLINQSFYFPQEEFKLEDKTLQFHDIDLMKLVQQYGAPLKFTYLSQISNNISRAKAWFAKAIEKHDYKGQYNYCYCTKSSHFKHVLHEALKNDIHIETSSAFDINIVESLKKEGKITDDTFVISNGFKRAEYISNIARLINNGHKNAIPVIDNYEEIDLLSQDMERPETPFWSYFCQISDSTTSYGSYSGAVPNEKITWGKLDIDTPKFVIESDATIVAPLIFAYLLDM